MLAAMRLLLSLLIALLSGFAWAPVHAEQLPIFDVHMHYSRAAWDVVSPEQVIAKMDKAGVSKALVSSTPDDGTLKVHAAAPHRIVAGYRPYESSGDLGGWFTKGGVLAHSSKRLTEKNIHRVFGEIHILRPEDAKTPAMEGFLALAASRSLYFHTHSDAAVVRALFETRPDLKIIWAHAGFNDPAPVVGQMLDRHANLWAELSYRARDIKPGETLDPEWEKVLIRHADRFVIGTDTWEISRWHDYELLIAEHRSWLGKLPHDAAEKIAYKNAERLLATKP
jgi:hypothetical protein